MSVSYQVYRTSKSSPYPVSRAVSRAVASAQLSRLDVGSVHLWRGRRLRCRLP